METNATLLQVILFSFIGGVLSLIGGALLISKKSIAERLATYATPFAAGVLLAVAFTDLLPEAAQLNPSRNTYIFVLLGILIFFLLERYIRFFHHHHEHEKRSSSLLVIIGDTLHNAIDGVAIGAAFAISPAVGIVTSLAVAAHEIPQEIGDFGLLLRNGMKRSNVLLVNLASAVATTVSAIITFLLSSGTDHADDPSIAFLMALTAGFFIYIASSDIIPEIHERLQKGVRDIRPWLLVFGALLVMWVSPIAHEYIDTHSHDDEHSSIHADDEYEHDDHDEEHSEEEHHEDDDDHAH